MNLEQLQQRLPALYPPTRTQSGRVITTHEAEGKVTKDGLAVTVKTLFPAANRSRHELVALATQGGLDIRPVDPTAMVEAERLAELVRAHWMREQPEQRLAPLVLVRDDEGRYCFRVARAGSDVIVDRPTDPATPSAKRTLEKGER
jgi:hypothetical protein